IVAVAVSLSDGSVKLVDRVFDRFPFGHGATCVHRGLPGAMMAECSAILLVRPTGAVGVGDCVYSSASLHHRSPPGSVDIGVVTGCRHVATEGKSRTIMVRGNETRGADGETGRGANRRAFSRVHLQLPKCGENKFGDPQSAVSRDEWRIHPLEVLRTRSILTWTTR